MFEITYVDGKLTARSNRSFLPVVRSFLRRLGFRGNDVLMTVVTGKPYDMLVSSLEMFEIYGQTSIDVNCKHILKDAADTKQKFEKTSTKATLLKNHDREYWEEKDVPVPKMVVDVSLKWYQKMSVMHAITLGSAANFSVPGSGKTWVALSAFLKMKYEKDDVDKLLVVSPVVAFRPWEIEYATIESMHKTDFTKKMTKLHRHKLL